MGKRQDAVGERALTRDSFNIFLVPMQEQIYGPCVNLLLN